jgi:hypothetical protein
MNHPDKKEKAAVKAKTADEAKKDTAPKDKPAAKASDVKSKSKK